jgi:hypothetical protein
MLRGMFCVSESDAAAIRTTFLEGGELAAALELCRRFVGLTSNADARRFVRTITAWQAPPERLPDTDPDTVPGPR